MPFRAALARLRALTWVRSITLMTHFARADDEIGISTQMARFRTFTNGLGPTLSLANSAALLRFPEAAPGRWCGRASCSMARSPMPDLHSAEALGLKPVMTLSSEIIGVQDPQPRRACRLRRHLRGTRAHAYRRGGLRLCRRLPAPCPHRHAHPGRRAPHPHPRARIHGHAGLRPHPSGRSRHRLACHPVGSRPGRR
jgi:hypothetical protein